MKDKNFIFGTPFPEFSKHLQINWNRIHSMCFLRLNDYYYFKIDYILLF